MSDINKFTANPQVEARYLKSGNDLENLLDLDAWNAKIAGELAEAEGIDLTDMHWEVIHFLRSNYQHCGPCPSGRGLQTLMEDQFARQGGRKYLYHLFPRGPVVQACKIAGLPLPPHSTDASFGSVM
jgi:tRNA 2-thiouridine synthesizing protein E